MCCQLDGLIAGAFKVTAIDKSLQQQESMVEMVQPIRGQPRNIQGQHMRGQIGNLNPRQDQKAAVGGQLMQVPFSLPRRPTDKTVSCGQFQCRCAPRQGRYRSIFKESKVLESMSQKSLITQVVMPADPLIPQRLPARTTDRFDGSRAKIVQHSGNCICVDDSRNRRQNNAWFLGLVA